MVLTVVIQQMMVRAIILSMMTSYHNINKCSKQNQIKVKFLSSTMHFQHRQAKTGIHLAIPSRSMLYLFTAVLQIITALLSRLSQG